jgi:hypothetical protein
MRRSIGMAMLAAGALASVGPARAELIVLESSTDKIKPGTRLEDNAASTLPPDVVVRVINPKTGQTFNIKGGETGASNSPIGISRSIK